MSPDLAKSEQEVPAQTAAAPLAAAEEAAWAIGVRLVLLCILEGHVTKPAPTNEPVRAAESARAA